jgi:3D (Asp-Asp-Asp) domain-containing protein
MRNLNLLVACFIVGDALALRVALASNRETMSSLMPLLKDCPILLRAKLPCLSAGYPEDKIRRIHAKKTHSVSHHAFIYKNEASSSRRSTHVKMRKKKSPIASNDHNISFKTFDASYVLTNKSGKVVAKYVGGKHKGSKTSVWVPKVLVSNVKGPKTVWVPKNKA